MWHQGAHEIEKDLNTPSTDVKQNPSVMSYDKGNDFH